MRSTLLATLVLATSCFAADNLAEWGKDHKEAKAKLLRVLENHAKAQNDFISWENDEPGQPRALVDFLIGKGDRNVGDFCDKEGKDARTLRALHKDYPEAMRGFREWVRDFPTAAVDAFKHKHVFKTVLKGDAEPRKKKDDDDRKKNDDDDNKDKKKKKKKDD